MIATRGWLHAVVAGAAAAAALAGCARPSSPGAAATPAAEGASVGSGADYVALERGPCFGTCPVYRVTVTRAGAVTFEGRRFVADSGTSHDSIPAAEAEDLFRRVAAGWSALADRYAKGEPGCGRFATDLPTVVSEVSLGGSVKRVEHDHGCQEAPDALDRLEQDIDSVAGVGKWVTH
jgi:hypothetical protein